MDDRELVNAFEAGSVPGGGFHHEQHVRVAWYYLRQHSLLEALERFQTNLRAFAQAQGKPDLYHETITTAYVLLINERILTRFICVLDDEQDFSGPHQAELFARDGFDRAGIFLQAPDVVAQLRVLLSQGGERRGEICILPARAHGFYQPLVAHQRIHDQHHRHECKNVIEQPPAKG